MKIERLLSIITYLLNRDVVTGKYLAEKYEVSERTIQRDIDSINMAGIPVVSLRGASGGYKILDSYRLSKQTATGEDIETLLMGLRSIDTAIDNKRVSDTLEKVKSLRRDDITPNISIDFGVAKENSYVSSLVNIIDRAIVDGKRIVFTYINANGHRSKKTIEPVALKFKWYAWYLVGYCLEKKDYRIFKLARMEELASRDENITNSHDNRADMFEELMKRDSRKTVKTVIRLHKDIKAAALEYLDNVKELAWEDDYLLCEMTVVEEERKWFAFFLSFADQVEIVEPEYMKRHVIMHAQKIIDKYKIPDN